MSSVRMVMTGAAPLTEEVSQSILVLLLWRPADRAPFPDRWGFAQEVPKVDFRTGCVNFKFSKTHTEDQAQKFPVYRLWCDRDLHNRQSLRWIVQRRISCSLGRTFGAEYRVSTLVRSSLRSSANLDRSAKIVSPEGKLLGPGGIGELWTRSPSNALGCKCSIRPSLIIDRTPEQTFGRSRQREIDERNLR